MKILITGLSGSGKTTLAHLLHRAKPDFYHFNGDKVRELYKNTDFSEKGRGLQASHMLHLSESVENCILDFIAPTNAIRHHINPDVMIFMDTIQTCQYEDTNKMFECPAFYIGCPIILVKSFDYDIQDILDQLP